MENTNNEMYKPESEMIKKDKKKKRKVKKDLNTYYVVEVNVKDKLSIVNRYRVIYYNKWQYLVKIKRNEVRLFENFETVHFWSNSIKFTYELFCKNLINVKQAFLIDKKSPYFYILIQRKNYEDFKKKLYSLNSNSNQFEIDFIRAARRLKNLKTSINNELNYISSRTNHLEELEEEKNEWIKRYKQTKATILNFYEKNGLPKDEKVLALIEEIKEIGWDKQIE